MAKLSLHDIATVGSLGGEASPATVSSSTASSGHTYNSVDYYKFTSSGSITFSKAGWVKLLVIGGGGGGAEKYYGSGGGAGGMYFDFVEVTASSYSIAIGASDNNSVALGKTALKGGHGVSIYLTGATAGGCGAGQCYNGGNPYVVGLQPTSTDGGYGFTGGNGLATNSTSPPAGFTYNSNIKHSGGGAGTGANGTNGYGTTIGSGGIGRSNTQLENFLTATSSGSGGYLGGGGGSAGNYWETGSGGIGGTGGGGNSGLTSTTLGGSGNQGGSGASGYNNTGGGGGASGRYGSGGNGGSGLCIIGLIAPS